MNKLCFLPVTFLAMMLVGSSASKADDPDYTCVIERPVSNDYYGSTIVVSGYIDYGTFDASINRVEISVIGDGEPLPCFTCFTATASLSHPLGAKCVFTATPDPATGFPSPGWYTVTVKGFAKSESEPRVTQTKTIYAAGSGPPDTE